MVLDKERFKQCAAELVKHGIYNPEPDGKYSVSQDFMLWCSQHVKPSRDGIREAILQVSKNGVPKEMVEDCTEITFAAIVLIGMELDRRAFRTPGHFM